MALATFALLSVLMIVEGSATQWKTHSVDTGYDETWEKSTCSNTWFSTKQFNNGSTACECGSDLGLVVSCDGASGQVKLLEHYCMTYDTHNISLVVGQCYFAYYRPAHHKKRERYHWYALPADPSLLNQKCEEYGRTGQLCGRCKDGYAPPVYSYNLSCVECTDYSYNWVKYMAAAFLPLTLFFLMVIIFRISVTGGLLDVFLFFSQIISFPALLRTFPFRHKSQHNVSLAVFILLSMHGVWNLDFFRLLYPPFCIHPQMTTLQVLALDYAIAVYPLLLIIITYSLIELHDYNFRLIVWLWKPFHRCFVCFRREWNIKNSLIDAFCTFLLLSYFKFLSVSLDLLLPVSVFNVHGETLKKQYLYFDGSVEYFGPEHLPFGVLALALVLVFNLLPLVLLCLYPCRCFQKCLNYCRIQCQTLHILMDSFQGCYKNGTSSTCDCRWFAALYLVTRIAVIVLCGMVSINNFLIPLITFLVLLLHFLITVFQPYKLSIHNTINSSLLFVFSLYLVSNMADIIVYETNSIPKFSRRGKVINIFTGILLVIPILYFIGLLLYKCFGQRSCTQRVCRRICVSMPCGVCRRMVCSGSEESLPDRMIHAEQYVALLAEPVTESEESDGMQD